MWQHRRFLLWWHFGLLTWRAFSSGFFWCSTDSCSSRWSHPRRWFLSGSEGPVMWCWDQPPSDYGYHCTKVHLKKETFMTAYDRKRQDVFMGNVPLCSTPNDLQVLKRTKWAYILWPCLNQQISWNNKMKLIMKSFSFSNGVLLFVSLTCNFFNCLEHI